MRNTSLLLVNEMPTYKRKPDLHRLLPARLEPRWTFNRVRNSFLQLLREWQVRKIRMDRNRRDLFLFVLKTFPGSVFMSFFLSMSRYGFSFWILCAISDFFSPSSDFKTHACNRPADRETWMNSVECKSLRTCWNIKTLK